MKLNEAISRRVNELLTERSMTQYQLFMKSGVPKSTIGNVINCSYDSVKLRVIHEMCQGLGISIMDSSNPRCLTKAIWNRKTPMCVVCEIPAHWRLCCFLHITLRPRLRSPAR